ncbi:MAG: DUF502 domain-containing protein [Candidatus Acidiferrales bacterium]
MRSIVEFVRTTLIGGVLFLVPVGIVLYAVREVFQLARALLAPLLRLTPVHTVAGVTLATLASVALLVLICFLAGLVVRTERGKRVERWLEENPLVHVPGYTIVQGLTRTMAGQELPEGMSVALARIEDAWQLAFVFDRLPDGSLTVLIPQAPNPFSGTAFYLSEDRVKPLDVSVAAAIKCIRRLGAGSKGLFKERLGPQDGVDL